MSKTVVGAVSVAIGAALAGSFKTVTNDAGRQLGRLGDTIARVEGQSSNLTAFKRQEETVRAARKEWLAARQRLRELQRAIRATDKPTEAMRRGISRAAEATRRARAAYLDGKTALAGMRSELERAGVSTRKLTAEERRLAATLDALRGKYDALARTGARLDALKGRRAELRGQAVGVLALGAAFAAPVRAAVDLETAQVRLGTVIAATAKAGETQAQAQTRAIAEATKHAVAFSNSGLTSANEMLDIQYAFNSAGLEAEAARAAASVAAKVATVTSGAPERVGEVIATVYNNMGDQFAGTAEEKTRAIGDLLTRVQFKYQIRDFGQLGESLKNATPALISNNIAMAQSGALLGALNTAGLQAGEAGTALSASLRQMSKASREFGFDLARNKDGGLDMIATLANMEAAVGGFGDGMDQGMKDRIQKVFGDEGKKGIDLLGEKIDELRQTEADLARNSGGVVDAAYERFVKSSAGQMKILRNTVVNAGAAIGTVLLPSLNAVVAPLAGVARFASGLAEQFPVATKIVIGAAVGLVGLKLAAIALGYAWTFVVGGALLAKKAVLGLDIAYALATRRTTLFAAATQTAAARTRAMAIGGAVGAGVKGVKAFGAALWGVAARAFPVAIAGLRALGIAFLTNPIGLAIGAIALAATLIVANWETVGPWFAGLWERIREPVMTAWNWIKTAFSWTPLGLIVKNWEPIAGFFATLWRGIVQQAGSALAWIENKLLGPIRAVKDTLGAAWNAVFGGGAETSAPNIGAAIAGPANDNRPGIGDITSTTGAAGTDVGSAAADLSTASDAPLSYGNVVSFPPSAPPPAQIAITVTVNAAPGMDEHALARQVKAALDDAMREAEARRRAANHD